MDKQDLRRSNTKLLAVIMACLCAFALAITGIVFMIKSATGGGRNAGALTAPDLGLHVAKADEGYANQTIEEATKILRKETLDSKVCADQETHSISRATTHNSVMVNNAHAFSDIYIYSSINSNNLASVSMVIYTGGGDDNNHSGAYADTSWSLTDPLLAHNILTDVCTTVNDTVTFRQLLEKAAHRDGIELDEIVASNVYDGQKDSAYMRVMHYSTSHEITRQQVHDELKRYKPSDADYAQAVNDFNNTARDSIKAITDSESVVGIK